MTTEKEILEKIEEFRSKTLQLYIVEKLCKHEFIKKTRLKEFEEAKKELFLSVFGEKRGQELFDQDQKQRGVK